MTTTRKDYQHQKYLERKYRSEIKDLPLGLTAKAITQLERENQRRRDINKIKRHQAWLKYKIRKEPFLKSAFSRDVEKMPEIIEVEQCQI